MKEDESVERASELAGVERIYGVRFGSFTQMVFFTHVEPFNEGWARRASLRGEKLFTNWFHAYAYAQKLARVKGTKIITARSRTSA